MVVVAGQRVLRQRQWTEEQLVAAGFTYYQPVKRLVMARILSSNTTVKVTLEVLNANAGDILVYAPGDTPQPTIDDYDHWPVKRDLFKRTYLKWDEPNWKPNAVERQLIQNGCLPFYRKRGVWALRLPISIYVQTLESPEPVIVPKGRWLLIGGEGEPYSQSNEDFYERYVVPASV